MAILLVIRLSSTLGSLEHSAVSLGFDICPRLFIDGGSDDGSAVRSFASGGFYRCGLHSPHRLYPKAWANLTAKTKASIMAPLREPSSWCVRSFEANPKLLPQLRHQEQTVHAELPQLRVIHGALSNRSAESAPQRVVNYGVVDGVPSQQSSTVTTFPFESVHATGPKNLGEQTLMAPSYDVREVIEWVVSGLQSRASICGGTLFGS